MDKALVKLLRRVGRHHRRTGEWPEINELFRREGFGGVADLAASGHLLLRRGRASLTNRGRDAVRRRWPGTNLPVPVIEARALRWGQIGAAGALIGAAVAAAALFLDHNGRRTAGPTTTGATKSAVRLLVAVGQYGAMLRLRPAGLAITWLAPGTKLWVECKAVDHQGLTTKWLRVESPGRIGFVSQARLSRHADVGRC